MRYLKRFDEAFEFSRDNVAHTIQDIFLELQDEVQSAGFSFDIEGDSITTIITKTGNTRYGRSGVTFLIDEIIEYMYRVIDYLGNRYLGCDLMAGGMYQITDIDKIDKTSKISEFYIKYLERV